MNGVLLHELLADDSVMKFRSVAVAGQPTPRQLTRIGIARSDRFVVIYGCTEVGNACIGVIPQDREGLDYETGPPVPGVEVKVVDREEQLVKRGERGELMIRSTMRFPGYLNDQERTGNVHTSSGWFKSGDSAIVTQDGRVIVEGRLSDSVISTSEGFQSVTLWEGRLKQHPGVTDAVVVVTNDDHNYKQVCYAVVPKDGELVTEAELVDCLLDEESRMSSLLHKVSLSSHFVFLKSFPKTNNGKVNRKEVANICRRHLKEISKDK